MLTEYVRVKNCSKVEGDLLSVPIDYEIVPVIPKR